MIFRSRRIRIEYIFLVIAVLNFSVTEFCKQKALKKFFELDDFFERTEDFASVQSVQENQSPPRLLYNNLANSTFLLQPYFYFNPELAQGSVSPSELKTNIHIEQWKIASGFDRLLFFSALLSFISVSFIIYRQFMQKSELERLKAVSDAHAKFSRDLHDTVAQDLAAIKIYQEKGEYEKSEFYPQRAFSQTRFLIDALHLNLSEPIENLIRETVFAFDSHFRVVL